jgi:hypothetical protein
MELENLLKSIFSPFVLLFALIIPLCLFGVTIFKNLVGKI